MAPALRAALPASCSALPAAEAQRRRAGEGAMRGAARKAERARMEETMAVVAVVVVVVSGGEWW